MAFTYILRCADGTLYVDHTRDLALRERNHNDGRGSAYTAKRRPIHMVYAEECPSLKKAIARERQVKRWTAEKKEALIEANAATMKLLSRRGGERVGFSWRDLLMSDS